MKNNIDIEEAISILMEGFQGSEDQVKGQRDAWERYFNLLRKDGKRLKEGRLNLINYSQDLSSSLKLLLRLSENKNDDIVSKILIIWRNVYLIQNETQAGKYMTVGERIDAYNRKVKELKKWNDLSPVWFDDNSKALISSVIQTELSEVWQRYKLEWFLANNVDSSGLGLNPIKSYERADSAINEGITETDKLLEAEYKRTVIIEIIEVLLIKFYLESSSKDREISVTNRFDAQRKLRIMNSST